ncbi:MAG: hypothetical protein VX589_16290 [Myxococcota bacterium]|nr:hypothetical protein [Myxococcota bacterium]
MKALYCRDCGQINVVVPSKTWRFAHTVPLSSTFDAVINGAVMEIGAHPSDVLFGLLATNRAGYIMNPPILNRPGPIAFETMIRGLLENLGAGGNSVCTQINSAVVDDDFCQAILVPSLATILATVPYELTMADDRLT